MSLLYYTFLDQTSLCSSLNHSATADLLTKNSILLQKILDDLLLMLAHPSRHGNNHKLK
jgi:hypothetical protein